MIIPAVIAAVDINLSTKYWSGSGLESSLPAVGSGSILFLLLIYLVLLAKQVGKLKVSNVLPGRACGKISFSAGTNFCSSPARIFVPLIMSCMFETNWCRLVTATDRMKERSGG